MEREHCLCELPKRLTHHESDKHLELKIEVSQETFGKRRPSGADHEEQQPGLPGWVRPLLEETAAVITFFPSAHA